AALDAESQLADPQVEQRLIVERVPVVPHGAGRRPPPAPRALHSVVVYREAAAGCRRPPTRGSGRTAQGLTRPLPVPYPHSPALTHPLPSPYPSLTRPLPALTRTYPS